MLLGVNVPVGVSVGEGGGTVSVAEGSGVGVSDGAAVGKDWVGVDSRVAVGVLVGPDAVAVGDGVF